MDELLGILLAIIIWPFTWWKQNNEESSLGQTEFNKSTERGWKRLAIIGSLFILIPTFLLWLLTLLR